MSKIKYLFLVMLSAFIGIFSNPEMLAASDSVAVTGLNNDKIVETVVKPEAEETVADAGSDDAYYYDYYDYYDYAPVYEEPAYSAPSNYIAISGMTIPLVYTSYTGEDDKSYSQMAWYYQTGHWIYGHNVSYVFGPLNWAYDGGYLNGMTFTVAMNGDVRDYTIVAYRLYDLLDDYTLSYNGEATGMVPIINAYLDGTFYNMAIMTCYNGGAQRLVVYAN